MLTSAHTLRDVIVECQVYKAHQACTAVSNAAGPPAALAPLLVSGERKQDRKDVRLPLRVLFKKGISKRDTKAGIAAYLMSVQLALNTAARAR